MLYALTTPERDGTSPLIYDAIIALSIEHHFYAVDICAMMCGLGSESRRAGFIRKAEAQFNEMPDYSHALKMAGNDPKTASKMCHRMFTEYSRKKEPDFSACVMICERTGMLVGFILFQCNVENAECLISHYFMHPEFRGHGLCQKMQDYLAMTLHILPQTSAVVKHFTHSIAFGDPHYGQHKRYLLAQKGARVRNAEGARGKTTELIVVDMPTVKEIMERHPRW